MRNRIVSDYRDLFYITHNRTDNPTKVLNDIKMNPPKHKIQISWLPSFSDSSALFRLIGAAHYTVGDKHITERFNRNDYQLILTVSGEGHVVYNDREYVLTPNSSLLVDCRKYHQYFVNDGKSWEYKHIHFQTNYPQVLLYAVPEFQENSLDAFLYFDKLSQYSCSEEANSTIAHMVYSNLINNMLFAIITENYRRSVASSNSSFTFSEVIQYIHDHYTEPIPLADMIKKFNYSESYFIRAFKKYYNCTPHQYIIKYRVDKVYELLAKGETLQSAVFACGFNSTSSFYHAIKSR